MLRHIRVRDYMTESLITFKPDMDVLDAIQTLVDDGISGAPVIDQTGDIVGILTEKDCLRVTLEFGYYDARFGKVSDYMTKGAVTVHPDLSLVELAEKFTGVHYRRFPVVERNRVVGIISRADVLRGLVEQR